MTGKPGSGKSTTSALAAKQIGNVYHFSIGEELRARAIDGKTSRYSGQIKLHADALKLHLPIPADMTAKIFEECIADSPYDTIIVDGYPQYIDRLPGFETNVAAASARVLAICRINIDDSVAASRLRSRGQRSEDVVETNNFIANRLKNYYTNIIPTIETLSQSYLVETIDGNRLPLEVATDLAAIVKRYTQAATISL